MRTVRTAIPIQIDRSASPRVAGQFARVLEASGVVDFFQAWDQLTNWWPRALWTPGNTPFATVQPDPDSYHDAFILGAMAAAATSDIGLALSTDSIRRGPVELLQTMLSLSQATDGNSIFMIGTGEAKQIRPFGFKRSEGLDRLRELFEVVERLVSARAPIDYDGQFTRLHNGWIGGITPNPPSIWTVGGGPQILDLAVQYAAGFATAIPAAYACPDKYAAVVNRTKGALEKAGRDPDDFGFGIWACSLLHQDDSVLEDAFKNPLLRFYGAVGGRLDQSDWAAEDIEAVFPLGWHYAIKLLPSELTATEASEIAEKASPAMVAKSFFCGTPAKVASELKDYVDAGANWVTILDFLPVVRPLDEAASAIDRSIEVCRLLKNADRSVGPR